MTRMLLCPALVVGLLAVLFPAYAAKPSLPAGLAQLAPDVLVVVGVHADKVERQTAETIAQAFRTAGGPQDNLTDDQTALTQKNRTSTHHLVLVGTYTSNDLLHQQWGHWAIDRPAFIKELAVPTDAPRPPFYPGAPTQGFFVCGYGTFLQPDTGYIEGGRNDLYLVPLAFDAPQQPSYKMRINITGFSAQGVRRAGEAFLRTGVLNAVIPSGKEKLSDAGDAFLLAKNRYTTTLPATFPAEHLLGWTQSSADEYAGFLEASGQLAVKIWRAKYLLDAKFPDYFSGLHRRETGNELFLAQLATPAQAQQAVTGLRDTLATLRTARETMWASGWMKQYTDTADPNPQPRPRTLTEVTLGGQTVWQAEGFHLTAIGNWVLMETLPEPQGAELMTRAIQSLSKN